MTRKDKPVFNEKHELWEPYLRLVLGKCDSQDEAQLILNTMATQNLTGNWDFEYAKEHVRNIWIEPELPTMSLEVRQCDAIALYALLHNMMAENGHEFGGPIMSEGAAKSSYLLSKLEQILVTFCSPAPTDTKQ